MRQVAATCRELLSVAPAATCGKLRQVPVRGNLRQLAASCGKLLCAATCGNLRQLAAAENYELRQLAATCRELQNTWIHHCMVNVIRIPRILKNLCPMNNRIIIPIVLVPVEMICISHYLMIIWHDSISVHVVLSCCQVFTWTGFSFDAMS